MAVRIAAAVVVVVLALATAIPIAFSETGSTSTTQGTIGGSGTSGGGSSDGGAAFPNLPALTQVRVAEVTPTSARILWYTDRPTFSKVDYKPADGSYRVSDDRCYGTSDLSVEHCIKLENLTPGTLYYFKASSRDSSELWGVSAISTFQTLHTTNTLQPPPPTTPPPLPTAPPTPPPQPTEPLPTLPPPPPTASQTLIISSVRVEHVATNAAQIRWDTSLLSESRVHFFQEGQNTSGTQPQISNDRCDGGGLVMHHCVHLTGLKSNVLYYYKVESKIPLSFGAFGPLLSLRTTTEPTVAPQPASTEAQIATTMPTITPKTGSEPVDSAYRTIEQTSATAEPVRPTARVEEPADLEGVNSALRTIQRNSRNIETRVEDAVTRDIQHVISGVGDDRLQAELADLTDSVVTAVRSGDESRIADLQNGLASSLSDIQTLIKQEVGVDIDLSPTARKVTSVVEDIAPQIAVAREELVRRDGQELYEDTDRDGVSNYDEKYIYKTDPQNAYTSGSVLSDGERVLLGFDVLSSSTDRIAVESPIITGPTTRELYEVYTIEVQKVASENPIAPSKDVQLPEFDEKITFAGRALPNSFVTLYIFSTPIVVTVKTDISGAWRYTLDTELPDGKHELYVATVDAGGKILAKSPAVPFVKTAEAAEYQPLLIASPSGANPLSVLRDNLIILALAGITIVGVVTLMLLGARKERMQEVVEKYKVPDSSA